MNDNKPGIGLLGGTFDPVHNGHISIAKSFRQSKYLNELWILLTPDPPHKPDLPVAGFDIRYKMLQAAMNGYDDIKISDIERKLPKPSYTVQTLAHLNNEYPDKNFYLCMGEDSLAGFKSWHKWQEILRYCMLLVAERPNGHAKFDTLIEKHAYFIPHDPIEISSTEIRKRIASGKDITRFVPGKVEDIINKYNLYRQ